MIEPSFLPIQDADAEMAKLLQEEENSTTGRRTRSGRQKNTAKSRVCITTGKDSLIDGM